MMDVSKNSCYSPSLRAFVVVHVDAITNALPKIFQERLTLGTTPSGAAIDKNGAPRIAQDP